MHFKLLPATADDLKQVATLYGPETGDLIGPALTMCWHVEPNDLAGAKRRAEWSYRQQLAFFQPQLDTTMRLVKVIDTDAPAGKNIVALGRWHEFRHGWVPHAPGSSDGRHAETRSKLESDNQTTEEVKEFNTRLYTKLLEELLNRRREPERFGTGPQWVLTTLTTREPYRRNGAGGMVLEWGLEQARKAGMPAYLEAAVGAKHLYETFGFKEIETAKIDCSDVGMPGVVAELAIMKADP